MTVGRISCLISLMLNSPGKEGGRRKSKDDISNAASASSQRRKSMAVTSLRTGAAAALSAISSAVAPSGNLIGKVIFDSKVQQQPKPVPSFTSTVTYQPIRNIKLVTSSPVANKVH